MQAIRTQDAGYPTLLLDGEPPSPGFARLQQPNYWAREKLDQFVAPGYDLFFVQIDEMETVGWCWDGRDGYAYEQYDHHIETILAKKSDARLILFVGGKTPYGWQQDHRDQLVRRENGTITNIASPSSPQWQADSCEALRRFVEHYESGPFADRIAGYNPIFHSNEWLVGTIATDHGAGATDRWRAWLRDRYDNDLDRLRARWKNDKATFEGAPVPTNADYDAHGLSGTFDRIESFGRFAGDYLRFFNESVADLLARHAAAIKATCDRRKLVSAMFGYTYAYLSRSRSPAHSGHMDLRRALDCPDLDLLHAPYDYYNRCCGGPHYSQLAVDSVIANGKVFATQVDTKTHVHDMAPGNARTPWESEQVLKRDIAFVLTRNAYHYYYEMCEPAWRGKTGPIEHRPLDFSPPNVQQTMVKLRRLAEEARQIAAPDVAQVALFTSRDDTYARALDPRYHNLFIQALRNYFLCYTGTPFQEYVLDDFDKVDLARFKVCLFPEANVVDAGRRRAIRSALEYAGTTAVWFYAPGHVDASGTGLASMEQLTGIRLGKRADLRDYLQIELHDDGHPLTAGLGGRSYGSNMPFEFFQSTQEWLPWSLENRDDYKFSPMFVADDPEARVHGTLLAARAPGLVSKRVGAMTSLFSAAPCPPPELLRNIFRHAGVHLYSDGTDLVYANQRFVAFCANGAGTKTLRLPRTGDLHDAFDQTPIARDVDRYTFDAAHGQVELFRLDA